MRNQIRYFRKQHQPPLSQAELARRVGISRQALIAIERGSATPSAAVAARICQALGQTFEEVFGGAEPDDHAAALDPAVGDRA